LTAADNQPTSSIWYPPASYGVTQIEVTFGIDANGNMKVTAADKGTGKSDSITTTNEKGQEEIDRVVADAERFASEDEAQRKRTEALNLLSCLSTDSKPTSATPRTTDEHKKTILKPVRDTANWIDKNGSSTSTEDLEKLGTHRVEAVLYSAGAGGYSTDDDEAMAHDHDEL